MRRFVSFLPALVVLLTSAAVLLAAPETLRRIGFAQTALQVELARQSIAADDILVRIDRAVAAIADAVEPSVVHLEVSSASSRSSTTGSGWVFDTQGHIITNSHVIRGADSIRVHFSDGRTLPAGVVGADPFTDIAVLRVNSDEGLFPVQIARGALPRKGDRVYAFGSPFGFRFSMSEGIVSGLGRDPQGSLGLGGYTNFIQTDAAVNPGNSGGPLVNVLGQLVGMNVAIATGRDTQGTTEGGDSAGISFAIPVGTIEPIIRQLIDEGKISRGFVGVMFREGEDRINLPDGSAVVGTRVTEVLAGGPAEKAGLRASDIIVSVAGYPVTGSYALQSLISSGRPGQEIPIEVLRDGGITPLTIRLGEMPLSNMLDRIAGQLYRQLGILTRSVYVGGETNIPAVAITEVTEGSIASRIGLRPGQIILRVGTQNISNRSELFEAVHNQGLLVRGEVPFLLATTTDPQKQFTIRVRIYP
ncbi:MAG: trypsin-like peptidase domain-containing protein [Phycisphaerales bacterium]|nr:trypsin-like peptidase domain-containing protein [Phycisphaerales bacterium]